jgi:hypothetical protein
MLTDELLLQRSGMNMAEHRDVAVICAGLSAARALAAAGNAALIWRRTNRIGDVCS